MKKKKNWFLLLSAVLILTALAGTVWAVSAKKPDPAPLPDAALSGDPAPAGTAAAPIDTTAASDENGPSAAAAAPASASADEIARYFDLSGYDLPEDCRLELRFDEDEFGNRCVTLYAHYDDSPEARADRHLRRSAEEAAWQEEMLVRWQENNAELAGLQARTDLTDEEKARVGELTAWLKLNVEFRSPEGLIDHSPEGTVDRLLRQIDAWIGEAERCAANGAPADAEAARQDLEFYTGLRDRLCALRDGGASPREILAAYYRAWDRHEGKDLDDGDRCRQIDWVRLSPAD